MKFIGIRHHRLSKNEIIEACCMVSHDFYCIADRLYNQHSSALHLLSCFFIEDVRVLLSFSDTQSIPMDDCHELFLERFELGTLRYTS